MTHNGRWMVSGMLFVVHAATVSAQGVVAPVSGPVDHPLLSQPIRSAGTWRQGIEKFGETLATGSLRLRDYEVVNLKLPGNRGIDLVAIKRNAAGIITEMRLIELKAHYGEGKPRLGQTRFGTQMSRQWLANRLCALRESGEQGKKLAREISVFRKANKIPLEHLGEVHDVNLRTGKYTIRNPVTMAETAGPMSIDRLLKRIAAQSTEPESRSWAMRHISQLDQLRQARMGNALSAAASTRALQRVSTTRLMLLEQRQALRGARRGLARAAGRVAVVLAVAVDAYEIYGHVHNYCSGKVSQQEFVSALARSGAGIAGAWGGAKGGAAFGAWLGTFGGPWGWITVPAGGVIGGMVGGLTGYFAGTYVGEFTAHAWYGSLDAEVTGQVSTWLKQTALPITN